MQNVCLRTLPIKPHGMLQLRYCNMGNELFDLHAACK